MNKFYELAVRFVDDPEGLFSEEGRPLLEHALNSFIDSGFRGRHLSRYKKLEHVDEKILLDIDHQAHRLLACTAQMRLLLVLLEKPEMKGKPTELLQQVFGRLYLDTFNKDEDLRKLSRTVLDTYYPDWVKEAEAEAAEKRRKDRK